MNDTQLLIDLHRPNPRQGPGSDAMTRQALALSGLLGRQALTIADLGCGTGASTLVLARELDAHITAIDLFPEFLEELTARARARGLMERITTCATSMEQLPFELGSLDAIWSEGAIYTLGFEAGVAAWRPWLKPGGVLAVSEITWLTTDTPSELRAHWTREYPEIDLASGKLAALERQGMTPIGYFVLPESCWLEHYYEPLRARLPALLAQHGDLAAVRALIEAESHEIDLYERHKEHISYGFYLARRSP